MSLPVVVLKAYFECQSRRVVVESNDQILAILNSKKLLGSHFDRFLSHPLLFVLLSTLRVHPALHSSAAA